MDLKKEYRNLLHPAPTNAKAMGRVKSFFSNPLSQYFIFALIMVILAVVSTTGSSGFITRSFVMAIGNTLIYAIVAIGFCLLLGYSGLASLGTAGFIGLGAYTAYYVIESFGLPYIVALAATLAVSIVIGVAVGFISLRIEGIYLAILTLGLSEILRNLLMAIKGSIKINLKNITLFGARIDETAVFMMILALFLILMYLTYNLIKSPTGRAMLAMKNSTSAAQAMGISLMKYRLLAFVISTVFAAVGGLMYMMYTRSINNSTSALLTITTSLNILGAVIIGGAKSLWGTTFGVFIIYGLQTMFLTNIPFFRENPAFITMITGLLIILVVMFYPGGFAQMLKSFVAWAKRTRTKFRRWRYGTEE